LEVDYFHWFSPPAAGGVVVNVRCQEQAAGASKHVGVVLLRRGENQPGTLNLKAVLIPVLPRFDVDVFGCSIFTGGFLKREGGGFAVKWGDRFRKHRLPKKLVWGSLGGFLVQRF